MAISISKEKVILVDLWWKSASQRPAVRAEELLASLLREAVTRMDGVLFAAPPPFLQRVQVLQAAKRLKGISHNFKCNAHTHTLRLPLTSVMVRGFAKVWPSDSLAYFSSREVSFSLSCRAVENAVELLRRSHHRMFTGTGAQRMSLPSGA